LIVAGLMMSTMVYANDAENSESSTVDHSKNPITGTKTTKRTWKKKAKGEHGEGKAEVTEKTSEKTDGTVEKKVETKSDTESK
jgi:hypothetical protein